MKAMKAKLNEKRQTSGVKTWGVSYEPGRAWP
jgi:hypothetical protein